MLTPGMVTQFQRIKRLPLYFYAYSILDPTNVRNQDKVCNFGIKSDNRLQFSDLLT